MNDRDRQTKVMQAATTTSTPKAKTKTKAKQKYLRQKKARRKLRQRNPASKKNTLVNEEIEEPGEYEESPTSTEAGDMVPEKKPRKDQRMDDTKRPKKRQKVTDDEPPDVSLKNLPEDQEKPEGHVEDPEIEPELGLLPSFPLPVLPDAPSKSALALQGLDKAFGDAEIVDPAISLPIPEGESDGGTMLSERTRKRLKELGITELFAVQTRLLPFLLPRDPLQRSLYQPYDPPRDVCVSAPTGSGKTLAYVLPIIEVLSSRIVTRLRALIVLPTRDLVVQVRETFEALAKGRGLQIGSATGQQSFSHEQTQLIADKSSQLKGGSSKVDILICTPGRLIDHISGTPNFSLQHLRFLVIDEADRLLAQSFQDWLRQVLVATRPPEPSSQELGLESQLSQLLIADAVAPSHLHTLPYPVIPTFITETRSSSCQKLLFSATLTRDPGKMAALELRDPKYLVVQENKREGVLDLAMEKFSVPSTLTEHMIICNSSQKPLIFFYLVQKYKVTNALVFTKSTESTTRLVRLFEFFQKRVAQRSMTGGDEHLVACAYSSDLPAGERKAILEKFKAQKIQILMCSDLISRGIDISHVSHVISYDVPVDMRKYVHRVGRTARAGRAGDAWTLVEEQEARYFKGILRDADHLDKVKRTRVSEGELAHLIPDYETALDQLKQAYTKVG